MSSSRKTLSYLPVALAGAYVLVYVAFLRDIPTTYYDFRYATVLEVVAFPILLFALGNYLGGRLRASGKSGPADGRGRSHTRKLISIVIVILYAALAILMVAANTAAPSHHAAFLYSALYCVYYVVMYGGIVAGFLYGLNP
jgi:hypothetical protein